MVLSSAVAGISVALQGLVSSSLVALGITYALLVGTIFYFYLCLQYFDAVIGNNVIFPVKTSASKSLWM